MLFFNAKIILIYIYLISNYFFNIIFLNKGKIYFDYDGNHHIFEETEEANEVVKSILSVNNEVAGMTTIQGNQRVYANHLNEWITDVKYPECKFHTIMDIKDEIEEEEEEDIKEQGEKINPTIRCKPSKLEVQRSKIVKPNLQKKNAKKPKSRGRTGLRPRPRPIMPKAQPITPASTPCLEQASTSHQIIMPPTQMPGIAYHIVLGDHNEHFNNPVQYAVLQPQPMFLQQTSSTVNNTSSVVINQSSMVINKSYQVAQAQISHPPPPKLIKIAPKLTPKIA